MDEDESGLTRFYTERSTYLIYEVKLFDNYVIARPATPGFEQLLRKLSWNDFLTEFEEYQGDPYDLQAFLEGEAPDVLIVTPSKRRVK